MSLSRMLAVATALVLSLPAARGDAAEEVRFLRAQAALNLGRTPTEELTFEVRVKNLAYAKRVTLHLNNGSGMWTDLDGSYVRTVDSQTELWQASIRYYDPASATANYTFAVKYEVAGLTFWDNNGGKNYTLQVRSDGLLLTTPVLLEAANADGASADVFGTIDVQNLAYDKKVTVFYTTDGWLTVTSTLAEYSPGTLLDNAERWSFVLKGVAGQPLEYAIAYQTAGATYWDNNYGKNYSLSAP